MKIRIALVSMVMLLIVPMASFGAQAPADSAGMAQAAPEVVSTTQDQASSECVASSPARTAVLVPAPIDVLAADSCDTDCATEQECDDFCAPAAGHCQIFIGCCVCF